MWSSRTALLPTPPDVVAAAGLRIATLPLWHAGVVAIDAPGVVDLRDPWAGGRLVVALGRREIPGSWRVLRRVRDTVHLGVATDTGGQLELLLSFSPWDGGTVVELGAGADGHRLHGARAGRRLDASVTALRRRVDHERAATLRPAAGRRTRRHAVPG